MNRSLGRSILLEHLAPIILLQILRSHIASATSKKDWLFALSDPKLSRAIEAMHVNVQKSWSLNTLAEVANMSRSGFASNFRAQVGLSPMEYLTHLRIHVACELLSQGSHSVAETADLVGYKSESSFSAAFKGIMNCRPGSYGKSRALW